MTAATRAEYASSIDMRRAIVVPLLVLAACSHRGEARRERVELALHTPAQTAHEDVLASRSGVARIASDTREAWTFPVGETVEIDAAGEPAGHVSILLGVAGVGASEALPAGRVRFEIVARGDAKLAVAAEVDLGDAVQQWTTALETSGPREGVHFGATARWIGNPPPNASALRAAVALPGRTLVRPRPKDGAPNVLVISVDTLRADRLGCYGYARPTSPRIDALAKQGTLFENAISAAPWTLPSYGSLFTSRLPSEHRAGIVTQREAAFGSDQDVASNATELLRADLPTLAGLFEHAGWRTCALHANPYLGERSGIGRGFERYVRYESNAKNGVDLAIDCLARAREERCLLFVHLMDPHWPYAPPAPFDERFAATSLDGRDDWPPSLDELRKRAPDDATKKLLSELYDGEIAFTDGEIGRLLAKLDDLGLAESTLVVLHADHGEEFWEHGGCDHGHGQHVELLHVPLVFRWPGHVPAGKRIASRVRSIDVLPTLLELAGLAVPDSLQGSSLAPLWEGRDLVDRDALSEAIQRGPREIKALAAGHDKLVASGAGTNALYDVARDPRETQPLDASAPRTTELRARLAAQQAKAAKSAAQPVIPLDRRTQEELDKLGYGGRDTPK